MDVVVYSTKYDTLLMQPRKIIVFFGKSTLRLDVRTPRLKVYKPVLNANQYQ